MWGFNARVPRTSGTLPHLKTVPKWPHHTLPPHPFSNHLHYPSRWRTLYTLLDSDSGPIHTTNALPPNHCPSSSLSVKPYHDPVPEPCSTCGRSSSSPLLPSSLPLSSPRTTARSSQRHKSLVRIITVRFALCHFANFSYKDPNTECTVYSYPPVAQNIHNFPTIWQPATLLANDSNGQALWQKIAPGIPNIAPKGQLNGSTINETYDLAHDPDCCEWRFSFLFCHFKRRGGVTVKVPIRTRVFGEHATGAGLWWLSEYPVAMPLRPLPCHR
jgi:hypothetical protein